MGFFLSVPNVSLANQGKAELQHHIEVFTAQNSLDDQMDALNKLQWSGLSDPALFDLLEDKLLKNYATAKSKQDLDLISWYAKSLGTSGLDVYRDTFRKIIQSKSHKKIRKYAQEGLDNLQKYKRWNPILTDPSLWNEDSTDFSNRLANMIRSDVWQLRSIAAKRILADNVYDDETLMQILEQAIKKDYGIDYTSKTQILTLAFMCRALAGSGKPEYKATLLEVEQNAGNKKVRKYARKYLKSYY